ncbi:type I-F CRISPR-associated helicase Cas3 [Brenneria alni]|uniref:Type I-F CRISPR-associated helicase Cas3 n=1 Tax=Brenneria alni TaxID=71656 RepID=A0A421DK81_9GAMM|nr:type I-F CRISPR-associated helicase Cas3f [Brenneria alni]RLM19712.1 type I-F CRISPR-associated helicase Cas3 [Brenneria alni]
MNILLVSQCNKRALTETRRVLDQFAERKGERTWQTAITLEGLNTLRKLLRKTARRNTAVACHWIKSANRTELLWIVGNLRRFNTQGVVPTNTTERDILKSQDENQWHCIESVSLLAGIAGLFHDFGKANILFQQGLRGEGKMYQPYRHEWISLRLFQAFVGEQDDQGWLSALSQISAADEAALLQRLLKDGINRYSNPFKMLPPLATVIAWLIVSHHRLPAYPASKSAFPDRYTYPPELNYVESWLTQQLTTEWNSTNMDREGWREEDKQAVWHFPNGTPMRSEIWCGKAQKLATRARQLSSLTHYGMLRQRFTSHLARLTLMLADHHYSSLAPTTGWQDATYAAIANTDRQTGQIKQKLDEHCIGVGQNALLLGRSLPHVRKSLPSITRHKGFKQRSTSEKYRWQDKAFDVACSLRERSVEQGFFGVNMASTGCGKTFANARIMYGLADEKLGCRFSVALGLRTLTLQTGDALRAKLTLQNDDLAVLIGSQAVSQLHQLHQDNARSLSMGSESAEALFAEHQYVRYDGSLDDGRLSAWLNKSPALHKLLSAPVLVTTIDHLIPATEGVRGGRQIAPMLRLLTADLVLDEPDDFDIADLPALCRLVNWAGMLGSRVLLSSATLPPALIQALFNAYCSGRADYQQACGKPNMPVNICCGWFDEHAALQSDHQTAKTFKQAHEAFVAARVEKLQQAPVLRLAKLVSVPVISTKVSEVIAGVAASFHQSMMALHQAHHQTHSSGKTVSLGLIRMANINPLVAVARHLFMQPSPASYRVHYCVYHSQHPLAMRSYIEQRLDASLTRYNPNALWQMDEVQQALADNPEQHHLFVALATSVAEVGRDHDYDWAIAEPSSMRSLIQLAGRIQRHRQQKPATPNLHILRKNVKALRDCHPAYCRPGFESSSSGDPTLISYDLESLLTEEQYRTISAIPRIQQREPLAPAQNLVDLEHHMLRKAMQGMKNSTDYYAALWWKTQADWSGELQRLKPFRQSLPDEQHYLWIAEEGDKPEFKMPDGGYSGWKESYVFQEITITLAEGVSSWLMVDYQAIYSQLSERLDMELGAVSQRFGEINLPVREAEKNERWLWHPLLGVFGALD